MQDIRDCIYLLISTIIILSNDHGMPCVTRVSNNDLRNNFYENVF